MEYIKESLDEISLYDLRRFAKEMGVKSPSMLRKKELIEAIIDVKRGNKLPDKSKKGRPCKKSFLGKEPNDDARFDEVISECEKLIKLRQELKEDVERILNEEFEKLKKRIINKILN